MVAAEAMLSVVSHVLEDLRLTCTSSCCLGGFVAFNNRLETSCCRFFSNSFTEQKNPGLLTASCLCCYTFLLQYLAKCHFLILLSKVLMIMQATIM